jgi:hypothetical protein
LAGSLWFYGALLRLESAAVVASKNLGVLAMKYVQGFVGGRW